MHVERARATPATGASPADDCAYNRSQGLAPLSTSWEDFYARHILRRVHDILGRPVASPPGAHITLVGPGGMGRAKSDA